MTESGKSPTPITVREAPTLTDPFESLPSSSRRRSSPQWKGHFDRLSGIWGSRSSASSSVAGSLPTSPLPYHLWSDLEKQKQRGGYPWTHLHHNQEEEVWIDPLKLPRDISAVTIRRRDKSIPKEWFHLPEGAEPPTVEELLRESSSDEEPSSPDLGRAKSPPICGRGRSKSRERKLHKHDRKPVTPGVQVQPERSVDPQPHEYETFSYSNSSDHDPPLPLAGLAAPLRVASSPDPVAGKPISVLPDDQEDTSTGCFSRGSRSRSKSKDRKAAKRSESRQRELEHDENDAYSLPPRQTGGPGRLAPGVDRNTKPSLKAIKKRSKPDKLDKVPPEETSYEVVGQPRSAGYEVVGTPVSFARGRLASDGRSNVNNPFLVTEEGNGIVPDRTDYEDVASPHPEQTRPEEGQWSPKGIRPNERLDRIMVEEEFKLHTPMMKPKMVLESEQDLSLAQAKPGGGNEFAKGEGMGDTKDKDAKEEKKRREKEEKDAKEEIKRKEKEEKEAKDESKRREKEEKRAMAQREKEAKEGKIKLENEAKEEKVRKDRAAKEEKLRNYKDAKEEKLRREKEAKEEKLRLEKEAKELKMRQEKEEKEAKMKKEKEAKEERSRVDAEAQEQKRQEREATEDKMKKEKDAREEMLRLKVAARAERVKMEDEAKPEKLRLENEEDFRKKEDAMAGQVCLDDKHENKNDEQDRMNEEKMFRAHTDVEETQSREGDPFHKAMRMEQEQGNEAKRVQIEEQNLQEHPKKDRDALRSLNADQCHILENESKLGLKPDDDPSQNPFDTPIQAEINPFEHAAGDDFGVSNDDWEKIEAEMALDDHKEGNNGLIFTAFEPDDAEPQEHDRLGRQAQDEIAKLFNSNSLERTTAPSKSPAPTDETDDYEDVGESRHVGESRPEEKKEEDKARMADRQQMLKEQYLREQQELKTKKDNRKKGKQRDKSQDSKLSFSFFSTTSSHKDPEDELALLTPSSRSLSNLGDDQSLSKKERAKIAKEAKAEKKKLVRAEKDRLKAEIAANKQQLKDDKKQQELEAKQRDLASKVKKDRDKREKAEKQAELARLAKEQKEEEKRKKVEEQEVKQLSAAKKEEEEKAKKDKESVALAKIQKEEENRKKQEEVEAKQRDMSSKEKEEEAKRETAEKQAELARQAKEQQEEAKREKQEEVKAKQDNLANMEEEAKAKKDKESAAMATKQKEEDSRKKEKEFEAKERNMSNKEKKEQYKREKAEKQAELARLAKEQKEEDKRKKQEDKKRALDEKKIKAEKQLEMAQLAKDQKEVEKMKKLSKKEQEEQGKENMTAKPAELAVLAKTQKEEQKKKAHHPPGNQQEDIIQANQLQVIPKKKSVGKDTLDISDPDQEEEVVGEISLSVRDDLAPEAFNPRKSEMPAEALPSFGTKPPKETEGIINDTEHPSTLHIEASKSKEHISGSSKAVNKRSFLSKLFHSKGKKAKSMSDLNTPLDSCEDLDENQERAFEPMVFSDTDKPVIVHLEQPPTTLLRPASEHLYEPIAGSAQTSPRVPKRDPVVKAEGSSSSKKRVESPPALPLKNRDKRAKHQKDHSEDSMATKSEDRSFWRFGGKKATESDLEKNGYHEEDGEDMDVDSEAGNDRQSRDRTKKPGLGAKMKNIRLPSPGQVANGYLSSNFHQKNFKQPLVSRTRVEDQDLQKLRQMTVERNTPGELASLAHPFDIPLPKFKRNRSKSSKPEESHDDEKDEDLAGHGKLYATLPRSWRKQNLVTGTKENVDPEVARERQELIKTKSPTELAQFSSITDFPVPSRIQNIFGTGKRGAKRQAEKRRHSASSVEAPSESWSKSLPRSWKDTKLVTNTKERQADEITKQRQILVSSTKPSELAQIRGFSDFPVPTLFKRSRSSSATRPAKRRESSASSVAARSVTRSMSGTLTRGWKDTKLVTNVRVEKDQDTLTKHRTLTQSKTPAELSQIRSVADFPVPTALEHFWKSDKKAQEADKHGPTHKSMSNLEDMYSNLPRALKAEILVSSKIEDEEVVKKRQKIVETKKPSELASINSISDIPLPSALENIFRSSNKPDPPSRKHKDLDEKRKRNRSVGALLSYEGLPDSLKAEVLVRSKLSGDLEQTRVRQELVKNKTPSQLASINGLSDFPLPRIIDTMVRPSRRTLKSTKQKDLEKKKSRSWSSLPDTNSGLFASLKREVEVTRKEEPDQELVRQHRETAKTKSVSDLAQITSLTDFPMPDVITNLMGGNKSKRSQSVERNRSETPTGKKETLYEKFPAALRQECLVRVVDENPELQRQRQELIRAKSPSQLGNIGSISDFPIPAPIQNLFHAKSSSQSGSPVPPPRKKDKEEPHAPKTLYDKLPESLKTEVLVRSKVAPDEKSLQQRREMTRSMSPAQLSEIHGFSDFPIPTFRKKREKSGSRGKSQDKEDSVESDRAGGGMFATLPKSLKSEMLVRSTVEDPEIQREHAAVVKSKSVHELSLITSFSDIPMPAFISRGPRPVERKKRFREKQRSSSAKNLYDSLPKSLTSEMLVKQGVQDQELLKQRRRMAGTKSVQELSQIHSFGDFPVPGWLSKSKPDVSKSTGVDSKRTSMSNLSIKHLSSTLPKALTQEVLVRSCIEDPAVLKHRRAMTQSKSVSELAQINSFSDFPIPDTFSRLVHRKKDKGKDNESRADSISTEPESKESGLYATLPKALKTEVLVRSRVEDPEISRQHQRAVQSKSVSELASIGGFSDFPLPNAIENLLSGRRKSKREPSKESEKERDRSESSRPGSRGPASDSMYASLPRSLKKEIHVRSKEVGDSQVMKERRALVDAKSPAELGQIHSFSEIPVPRMVEQWLHTTESKKGLDSPQRPTRSAHELRGGSLYDTLPRSLKEKVLVGSTIEDPDLAKERAQLARSKSPSELGAIRGLGDIPIPGLWSHQSTAEKKKKMEKKRKEPKETKESNKLSTLNRPCVVRSKIEDPEVLRQRQELQQNKSIHELSKINNINEIPFPFKIPLPDIPFPQPTKIFTLFKKKPAPPMEAEVGYTPSASPITNPDTTEAELLQYESGSIELDTHREQDFGYEIIDPATAAAAAAAAVSEGLSSDEDRGQLDKRVPQHLDQLPNSFRDDLMTQPNASRPQAYQGQDAFGEEDELVEQYRGTPERKIPSRNKRRNQHHQQHAITPTPGASAARYEGMRANTPPPPLPPKHPGGRREDIINDFEYEDDEEEDMEPVPVKAILTLEAANGSLLVRKNQFQPPKISHSPDNYSVIAQKQRPMQVSPGPRLSPKAEPMTTSSFMTEVGFGKSPTPPPSLPIKTRIGAGGDTLDRTLQTTPNIHIGRATPHMDNYDEDIVVSNVSLNLLSSTSCPDGNSPNIVFDERGQEPPAWDEQNGPKPRPQPRKRKVKTHEDVSYEWQPVPVSPLASDDDMAGSEKTRPSSPALHDQLCLHELQMTGQLLATTTDDDVDRIQSRPLPPPPAPKRTLKKKTSPKKQPIASGLSEDHFSSDFGPEDGALRVPSPSQKRPGSGASIKSGSRVLSSEASSFHTAVQSTMDPTLVDSSEVRRRHLLEDDEETLADSVVDSMHSCADTIVPSEDDLTLHGPGGCDTDMEGDDDLLSDNQFHSIPSDTTTENMQHYVRRMQERPDPLSQVRPIVNVTELEFHESQDDTQGLSRELLEDVGNLRSTLDHMSSRLGTSPQPPSQS